MNTLGITEIAGPKGSAKTRYAVHLIGLMKTLYFSSKPQAFIPPNSYIVNVHDLLSMKKFMENIESFVQINAIECLVVDTFDSLCITKPFNETYKDIYVIISFIRSLSFKYGIAIFILNEFDNGYNFILKRWYTYLVNRRYEIKKQYNVFEVKKRAMYTEELTTFKFIINGNDLEFLN